MSVHPSVHQSDCVCQMIDKTQDSRLTYSDQYVVYPHSFFPPPTWVANYKFTICHPETESFGNAAISFWHLRTICLCWVVSPADDNADDNDDYTDDNDDDNDRPDDNCKSVCTRHRHFLFAIFEQYMRIYLYVLWVNRCL